MQGKFWFHKQLCIEIDFQSSYLLRNILLYNLRIDCRCNILLEKLIMIFVQSIVC